MIIIVDISIDDRYHLKPNIKGIRTNKQVPLTRLNKNKNKNEDNDYLNKLLIDGRFDKTINKPIRKGRKNLIEIKNYVNDDKYNSFDPLNLFIMDKQQPVFKMRIKVNPLFNREEF